MQRFQVILMLCFVTLWGCSDFLDEEVRSLTTPEVFFTEASSAQSSVDALYSLLDGDGVYAREMWQLHALFSDNGFANSIDPAGQQLSNFTVDADNPIVSEIWRKLYEGVNASNFAIAGIPTAPISEPEQVLLIGEARFFRGLFYFELVRCFGGVPLQTEPVLDVKSVPDTERASVDSVYAQIIRDFSYALDALPASTSNGRPSSWTATAYLGKVYSEMGQYRDAFPLTRAVILSMEYTLLEDYSSNFAVDNKVNSEIILASPLSDQSAGNVNVRSLPGQLNGRSLELPTDALVASFSDADVRKQASIISSVMNPDSSVSEIAPHVSKYWDEAAEPNGGPTAVNYPVLRYSDILLLHAEIVNELNTGPTSEAYFVANLVRERAGVPPLSGLNQAAFREAILEERQRELAWEGYRWYDLKRMGQLESKVSAAKPAATVEAKHMLLPIPNQEISINPRLIQNEGYD